MMLQLLGPEFLAGRREYQKPLTIMEEMAAYG